MSVNARRGEVHHMAAMSRYDVHLRKSNHTAVPETQRREYGLSTTIGFGCTCGQLDSTTQPTVKPDYKLCPACAHRVLDGRTRPSTAVTGRTFDEAYSVVMAKRKTPPVPVTPAFIKSLCEPHFAPSAVEGSGVALPDRRSLPVDHRCRCSTNLMQLATRVHKSMDELELRHWDEISKLRKQVALAKAVTQEWSSAFGDSGRTPLDVLRELECLKKQNRDLADERKALLRQHDATKMQVDALVQQLKDQHS